MGQYLDNIFNAIFGTPKQPVMRYQELVLLNEPLVSFYQALKALKIIAFNAHTLSDPYISLSETITTTPNIPEALSYYDRHGLYFRPIDKINYFLIDQNSVLFSKTTLSWETFTAMRPPRVKLFTIALEGNFSQFIGISRIDEHL